VKEIAALGSARLSRVITWLPLRVGSGAVAALHNLDDWHVSREAFTAIHCTLGDVVIAGLALLGGLVVFGSPAWPLQRWRPVFAAVLAGGVAYPIYSEWLNTTVRQSWAYSPLMPVLPVTGTGLAPLLQWIVVPSTALALTRHVKQSS